MENPYTPPESDELYSTRLLVDARELADQAFIRELTVKEAQVLAAAVMMAVEIGSPRQH